MFCFSLVFIMFVQCFWYLKQIPVWICQEHCSVRQLVRSSNATINFQSFVYHNKITRNTVNCDMASQYNLSQIRLSLQIHSFKLKNNKQAPTSLTIVVVSYCIVVPNTVFIFVGPIELLHFVYLFIHRFNYSLANRRQRMSEIDIFCIFSGVR